MSHRRVRIEGSTNLVEWRIFWTSDTTPDGEELFTFPYHDPFAGPKWFFRATEITD
jgi:hypothetical protein